MYEYKLIDSRELPDYKKLSHSQIESILNDYGREGWEIIDMEFQGLSLDERFFIAVAKRKRKNMME